MDYLRRMPFTVAFIDKKGKAYQDSSKGLNDYIGRHPLAVRRLHQPKFAAKFLEMAAHNNGMQVVRRPADTQVKRELVYIIRKSVFKNKEAMWRFINDPSNLNIVR